jgi:hypothetical protein
MPQQSEQNQVQDIMDVQHVFNGTLEGQRVWKHLEARCFENKSSFSQDPYQNAFNAGVRSVLLHLKTLKNIDLAQYETRKKEQEKQNDNG